MTSCQGTISNQRNLDLPSWDSGVGVLKAPRRVYDVASLPVTELKMQLVF